jgi:hypothetical protein
MFCYFFLQNLLCTCQKKSCCCCNICYDKIINQNEIFSKIEKRERKTRAKNESEKRERKTRAKNESEKQKLEMKYLTNFELFQNNVNSSQNAYSLIIYIQLIIPHLISKHEIPAENAEIKMYKQAHK